MARTFDPALIYDTVQSFWREYYKDRAHIERLWEAMIRAMDDEWAQAEQVNDSVHVVSCPTNIYHTYLYRKLENWHSYGVPHRHFRRDFRATAGQTIFYTGGWPDPATLQLFINGKETDEISDPYVLTLDQDATQPSINPTGARLIFEHPMVLNTPVSLFADREWVRQEIEIPAGGAMALTFGAKVDPASFKLTLKKFNLNSSLTLTATTFAYTSLPSVTSVVDTRTFRRGEVFEVVDGPVKQSISLASDTKVVTIPAPVNPLTATVYKVIDLEVTKGKIQFSEKGLQASNQTFPTNVIVRASDCSGSLGTAVVTPVRTVEFARKFEPETRKGWMLGGEITGGYECDDQDVSFHRSFQPGTVLLVEAALWVENDHAEYREVLAAPTNQVSVPVTRPFALDPLMIELQDFPVQFFINGHLLARDTYFFPSTTTIRLNVGIMPAGVTVDLFYVDLEDPLPHRHVREAVRVLSPTSAFELSDYVSDRFSRYVSVGGVEVSNPVQRMFRQDGHFLAFTMPIPAGTMLRVRGAHRSHRYWHEIDPEFVRADYLQDGIDEKAPGMPQGWSIQLPWNDGFDVPSSGLLDADEAVEDAWFVNAWVDERTAYANFGSLIGLDRPTSDDYVKVLRALIPGSYMGSTPNVLESMGCIVLGSDYLLLPGKVDSIDNDVATVGDRTYVLDLSVPSRVAAGQAYGRYHAVTQYVRILDEWDPFDEIVFMAYQFSEDYSFARTVDIHRSHILNATNANYSRYRGTLIDTAVDFIEEEVWQGDLVRLFSVTAPATPLFGRVTKVEQHSLTITIGIPYAAVGYGNYGYGTFLYGSGWDLIAIPSYTVWTRRTDRQDVWRHLDEALAEDIPYLSARLHDLLSPFVFLAEVRWEAIRSGQALNDLTWFLDRSKPADTEYIAYTRVQEDSPLAEVIEGVVGDVDPTIAQEPNFAIPCSDDSILAIIGIDGQISPNVGSFIGV